MRNKINKYLLLIFILILPILLGGGMILNGDFYFLIDQARDMFLVQDIVVNMNPTLIGTHSGLGGFFHGPAWLYQLIPFYLIGGGDPLVFAYLYLLIPVATVLIGYVLSKKLYGEKEGLIFATLLAVSPAIWSYIPNTIGVNMVPLIFIPMFYFLVKYIRGDKKAFIFAVFFAGFSLQYETALPLILIPIVFASIFLNKKAVKDIKLILLIALSFAVSVSSFILFDLKHNFLQTRALLSFAGGGERQKGYLEFGERIMAHLESFLRVYKSILIRETFLLEIIYAVLIAFFVYIALKNKLYKKDSWKEFIYLALFPLVICVPYLFYPYPVFPEYLLGLSVPVVFAFVFVLKHIYSYDRLGKMLCIIFAVLTLIESGKIINTNLLNYKPDTTAGSYQNQKDVVEWIINDAKGEDFGYFAYMDSTYTYPMDYLLWWETKTRGTQKPESKKQNPTYLVLYPAPKDDLKAHEFWKTNKIKTKAPVITKEEFDSGIIVEKLLIESDEEPEDPLYHQGLIFR